MTTKEEKDTQPNEAEIIFNRANVALARSQRLVASWLNSPSSSTDEHKDQEAADVKDDDEIFTPVPERYLSPSFSLWFSFCVPSRMHQPRLSGTCAERMLSFSGYFV